MQWTRSAVVACLVALVMVACGPKGPSEFELAQEAEWEALQEAKQALDEQRQKLRQMRQQVAAAAAEQGEEGEQGDGVAPPTAAEVAELESSITEAAEEFGGRLVNFLNDDPMTEGEPPTERQLAALRLKSAEDIALGKEWIEKGGDYKRAIDIYNNALKFDPDNEDLKQALAEAEAGRYMTQERFEMAKKKMTEAEVRAALGQANLHNVKPFPDKKTVAWFYPTDDKGSAAAVWFREENGVNRVYRVKFDEVKPKQEGEEAS